MTMTTVVPSCPKDASQISQWLNEAHHWFRIAGDKRLSRNKLVQARTKVMAFLQGILQSQPLHAAALSLKYRVELAAGHNMAALGTLRRLVRTRPRDAEILMAHGQTALLTKHFGEAEAAFQAVLARQTDRADAYCGIAAARLGQHDHTGAFLRATSLYGRGFRSSLLYSTIEDAARHLGYDRHQPQSEALLIELLQDSHINPESLSTLAASLLRHKYALDDPEATIDIAACASDPLLINALLLTTLQDGQTENFVALLRQHIFLTACATGDLEEGLQTLAIAIAVQVQRTDYLCPLSDDESALLDSLQPHIELSLEDGAGTDDLAAALLLISLYRPLYPERYSFKLLRWDLDAWPLRLQSVFKLNLYDYANEHALRHELNQSQAERESELIDCQGRGAFPKWSLPELVQDWRQLEHASSHLDDLAEPHILVLGCGSGRRAIALAQYYPHALVLAIDDNAHDLAYASRQASEIGCENIEFSYGSWKKQLPLLAHRFDLIECTAFIPSPARLWCEQLKRLTSECGVIHLRDNRLVLPREVDHSGRILQHDRHFVEWRNELLADKPGLLSAEARQALFNREGARRLMRPDARHSQDLAETLQRYGIALVGEGQETASDSLSESNREVQSLAM